MVKDIQEKRITCQRHLSQFRQLQAIYMPCVAAQLAKLSGSRLGDIESEPVFLPSALEIGLRGDGCYKDMAQREAQLRKAQCYDALEVIRTMQRTKRSIKAFRYKNLRGVAATTRTSNVLERLNAKSELAVTKYRAAREALLVLVGPGDWQGDLRVLKEADVRVLDSQIFEIDIPKAQERKLGNTGTDVHQLGSGSYEISWIWMVRGSTGTMSQDDVDGQLRVEWLKSRARVMRYREEIVMVTDERAFTLASLEHEACKWETELCREREDLDVAGQEGISALAKRQAAIRRNLANQFKHTWSTAPRLRKMRVPDRSDLQVVEMSDSEEESTTVREGGGTGDERITGDDAGADADNEEEA